MIRILSVSLSLFVLALLADTVQASATYNIDLQGTGGPDNHFLRVAGTITFEGDLITTDTPDVIMDSSLMFYHDSDEPVLLTLLDNRLTNFEEENGILFLVGGQTGNGSGWTVAGNEFVDGFLPRFTLFTLDGNGIATIAYDHRSPEAIEMEGLVPLDLNSAGTSDVDLVRLGSFGQRLQLGNRVGTVDPDPITPAPTTPDPMTPDPSAVPEPSSITTWLILVGFVAGSGIMRRRSRWLASLR